MASGTMKMIQNRLGLIHTTVPFSNQSISAHYGKGTTVSVTVPEGERILCHVVCWSTGMVGLIAGFDNYSGQSSNVSVYVNNTNTYDVTTTSGFYIHVLTITYHI